MGRDSCREDFLALLKDLEIPHTILKAADAASQAVAAEVVGIDHGSHKLLGFVFRKHVIIVGRLNFAEDVGALIDSLATDERERFLYMLRREILDGRTGFDFLWKDDKRKRGLARIQLEQKVAIYGPGGVTAQHLLDALQEVVVLKVRAEQLIMGALSPKAQNADALSTGTKPGHDQMFH